MRKRGSFMTAPTISSNRANGPAAMSPRIRAENRERERERELIFFADFSTCEYGGIGRGCRKHGDRLYGGSLAGWNASIFRKEVVSPPPSFPEGGGKTTRVQWRRDATALFLSRMILKRVSFDTCSQHFPSKQTILEERVVRFISNRRKSLAAILPIKFRTRFK